MLADFTPAAFYSMSRSSDHHRVTRARDHRRQGALHRDDCRHHLVADQVLPLKGVPRSSGPNRRRPPWSRSTYRSPWSATMPTAPTHGATPTKSTAPSVAAPIEARTVPATVIPTIASSAEEELGLLNICRVGQWREPINGYRAGLVDRANQADQRRSDVTDDRIIGFLSLRRARNPLRLTNSTTGN